MPIFKGSQGSTKKNMFERNDSDSEKKIDDDDFVIERSSTEDSDLSEIEINKSNKSDKSKKCDNCPKLQKIIDDMKKLKVGKKSAETVKTSGKSAYYSGLNLVHVDDEGKTVVTDKTDIHCLWDCHSFDGPPCFLPEKYFNDKYYIMGCFCSLNCALSYNVYHIRDNRIWERKSLLEALGEKCLMSLKSIFL